ncbi:MAG: two-component regulator propeller domain-containing protein [Flavobacteriales bacterium]|jgi:ligand-binding sensor domain-containing protein
MSDKSFLWLLCSFAFFAVAGNEARAQAWEVFDMEGEGLPSNTITDIVQDHDGVIWVGTDWGLCRREGSSWTVLQAGSTGLSGNEVTCLSVDSLNRLWVGTATNGIAILDGGNWSYLNNGNSPMTTEGVKHIHHDHRGWVWVSTELGLFCHTGDEWRHYNNTPESYGGFTFFGPNVRAVDVREDGLVAVATMNAGLTYLTETEFIFYTAANSGFPDNSMNDVAIDANGDRWLACPSGGLIWHASSFMGGPVFQYNSFTAGLPDNTLLCVIIDNAGRKLLGSETAGIILFEGQGNFTILDQASTGLPSDHVRCLLLDSAGGLWAGTDAGVARFDPSMDVEDRSVLTGSTAYPNPVTDVLYVQPSGRGNLIEWQLADELGRIVQHGTVNGFSPFMVDMSFLAPGHYIVKLRTDGGNEVLRVVRN